MLSRLQSPICVAKKVGEGLGAGAILLGSMPKENERVAMSFESVGRTHFEAMYAGLPPWDIGRP
jgi:hypothetical protein